MSRDGGAMMSDSGRQSGAHCDLCGEWHDDCLPSQATRRRCADLALARIAAIEARIAELEPLAEVGRLVEAMPDQSEVARYRDTEMDVYEARKVDCAEVVASWSFPRAVDALRALVGEKDDA